MADVRYTVRYPSGAVEYRYGASVPKRVDRIGRNGDEGFVTSVERDKNGDIRVVVGTRAASAVTWADASGARSRDDPRERIMEAAYGLLSQRGVRAVSMEDLLDAANVSQATLETNFATKDDVVLAFLHRREHRWTLGFVEAAARSRGATARDRLLAIFDVFDEWFQRDDFEGCSSSTCWSRSGTRTIPSAARAPTISRRFARSSARWPRRRAWRTRRRSRTPGTSS
jgi:AcrR family transcriptional regulator